MRPVNTGWFAGFGELAGGVGDKVSYASDGMRMMGATFDPSGWFRFNSVWDRLTLEQIGIPEIHAHIVGLHDRFLADVGAQPLSIFDDAQLLPGEGLERGHFLTFRTQRAGDIHEALRQRGVLTDYRHDRLRFGFGLYHDEEDVDALMATLRELSKL